MDPEESVGSDVQGSPQAAGPERGQVRFCFSPPFVQWSLPMLTATNVALHMREALTCPAFIILLMCQVEPQFVGCHRFFGAFRRWNFWISGTVFFFSFLFLLLGSFCLVAVGKRKLSVGV
jgi:hypothetical protein